MDILEQNYGEPQEDFSLDDLMQGSNEINQAPQAAIRNRAATTAIMSSSSDSAINDYFQMVAEGEQGNMTTINQFYDRSMAEIQDMDMKTVMDVLGDPGYSLEQKRQAMKSIQQSQFLKDSGVALHTKLLSQGSAGETFEAEDARLTTADMVREIYEARNAVQGLVNRHGAMLEDASLETVADMTALYVMPFGNSISKGKIANEVAGTDTSLFTRITNYLLPGNATMSMRERLARIPPDKRVEFARAVLSAIQSKSGIIFGDDNQFAQFDAAFSVFAQGGYDSFQQFVDNISPLLDVIGVGQFVRGLTRGVRGTEKAAEAGARASAANPEDYIHTVDWELVDRPFNPNQLPEFTKKLPFNPTDQAKRIQLNSIKSVENPASPAKIIQQSNPEKARDVHNALARSDGDVVAEGLYGTNKIDALGSDLYPQVATETEAVTSKVVDIERKLRSELANDLSEMISNTGAIYYTKAEKARARSMVMNDFAQAEGMTINDAMSSFKLDGGDIQINAVFGTPEGSFLRAEDAFEQAKLSLRNYGIRDDEITILRKEGLDHVPVPLNEAYGVDGNYLVQIKTKYPINPDDVGLFDSLDVKRNWWDRVGLTVTESKGSLSRWLFDAASMVHPTISGSAAVASDATSKFHKGMLGLATEFSDIHQKLPKDRRAKLDDYIREANFNEIAFDPINLVARGFDAKEIEALAHWRDFWDAHYYLENLDVVRTLNSNGFKIFKNDSATLFARPIPKDGTIGSVYDPVRDAVRAITRDEIDDLYDKQGTLAKLRRPTEIDGRTTEYMMVRNTPDEYLRTVRDSDAVLNYRNGYYQIQYKAPKFVEQITRDTAGRIIDRKAVAVAGDTKEAEHFRKRMEMNTGKEYKIRGDIRALRKEDDAYWDLQSSSGRLAQRHRGKLLEDASGLNHLGDGSYIVNPVDSALRAAQSISGRTVTRPMIEAGRARMMQQYGDMFPPDGMGGHRYPKSVKEIEDRGNPTSSRVADARTMYEYLNYLENGYINTADDVFKATFHAIADGFGKLGWSKMEKGAAAISTVNPTSTVKSTVFFSYIGSNFLRQWIVQPHQVMRTFSYNPKGWTTGAIEKYFTSYVGQVMGLTKSPSAEARAFKKFIDDSGLLDAVDKNNLIRGSLIEAADTTNKVARLVGRIASIPRIVGFDKGEQANLLGHAAAVYDRYKRAGRDLTDKAVRDEAYSQIRAISYEMNFAGDMPYNQTTPALLLQFMQVPHKAMLQLTNRRIPVGDRLRMFAGDLILWGPPTLLVSQLMSIDILPDNPEAREAFTYGVESWALNRVLTQIGGERTSIDFSSLAPYELTGWQDFFTAMYEGGTNQLIMNSPGGQLFLKEGGRIQQAVASMGRYFGMFDEVGQDKTSFMNMLNDVAKISSGWNNWQKAQLMLNTRKRLDQYGSVTDEDVSRYEAFGQALGFGTSDTRDLYLLSKQMSKDVKSHKEDVLKSYNDIKRYYASELEVENTDPRFITAVTGYLLNIYRHDPVAQDIIYKQLSMDLRGKDRALLNLFMKRSGIPDLNNLRDQVRRMPVSDEEKQMMMQRIEDMENTRMQFNQNEEN